MNTTTPARNPFYYGNPVSHEQFLGRRRELRRIVGRITNLGQSTAIVGEPRSGKTSLLLYLAAPETRAGLYGTEGVRRLIFSYLDAQTLGETLSQPQFWDYVLGPLVETLVTPAPASPVAAAYRACQQECYAPLALERLFVQLEAADQRLVLLLDEFDLLLHHPQLNQTEFFGSLRSLASRSRGALALVTAGRSTLAQLNTATQELSRTGSPYFNFLSEVTLGPLTPKDASALLSRAGDRFTTADVQFCTAVAGGHPYLLQAVASELWDAYEEDPEDAAALRQEVAEQLYPEVSLTLKDTWRLWAPEVRCAFVSATLQQLQHLRQCLGPLPAARPRPTPHDEYSGFEVGLSQLFALIGRDHPEALIYEQRLLENLQQCRRYGNTETRRSERAQIIAQLNQLALRLTDTSFNALCDLRPPLSLQEATAGLTTLLGNLRLALRTLEQQGFVEPNAALPGGWQVRPQAFLWWMTDQILSHVRDKPSLEQWWRAQGWTGLLSLAEEAALGDALRATRESFPDGPRALIAQIAQGQPARR